jgi:hypothetical protein
MSIKTEELNYSQEEYQIKAEYVFLEKSDKPSSRSGNGITEGVLVLTNKRLFFIAVKRRKSSRLAQFGIKFAAGIIDEFTFGAASWAQFGIEKGIEHARNNNIDITMYAQGQDSFVIPLHKLVGCEKFGGLWSTYKGKYVRFVLLQDSGVRESYSIYSVNPKNTESTIQYEKWYDALNDARVQIVNSRTSLSSPIQR